MSERFVETNGVPLCIETLGNAADPAIVLIHGACASMVHWESARHVICSPECKIPSVVGRRGPLRDDRSRS